jgi:hypothetical protein
MVFGFLGIFVGYDVLDNGYTWREGVVWHLLGIISGGMTAMLHAVGHHQMIAEQEDITRLVDARVGDAFQRVGGELRTQGGTERR